MRLDKFLTECGVGSRKEVKKLIDSKRITLNGEYVKSPQIHIDYEKDIIMYDGNRLEYKEFRYYVLNKKAGYITATEDVREKTVMELLPDWVIKKDLTPVGRLDKDTEGILLFTNNGKLAHELLSPKKHIKKIYYALLEKEIGDESIEKLKQGVDIGGYITQPAEVEKISTNEIHLTISEGKFHQVKKMLIAVGNKVEYLKRIKFGKISLNDMELGEVIEIELDDIV